MRRFTVAARCAPNMQAPEAAEISGGFSFGAFNAACEYARERLPAFDVVGGRLESFGACLWRFEAVNLAAQTGAVLWVREL